MPAKKTAKKRATKKVASSKGAVMQLQPKSINEVIDFLKANRDFAVGLHDYFEGQRDSLLQSAWAQGSANYDMKCAAAAMYITDEILSLGLNK